jgi:hypothetical protein
MAHQKQHLASDPPHDAAAGLNNCDWFYDGFRQSLVEQPNSPIHHTPSRPAAQGD